MPDLRAEGSVHEGPATPHHALGTRARCRCRAGASGQESGCDAYSPRDSRASVRHAEDADGGDALFDEDAAQSGDRDGAARARLQPYARDEHLRYQTVARSDPGLRRVLVRAVRPLRSLSTARGCARIDSRTRYSKNRLSRSPRGPSRPVACSYWGTKNVSTRPGPVSDIAVHENCTTEPNN